MAASKRIDIICIGVLIVTVLVTVLFLNGERFGIQRVVDEDAEGYEGDSVFTANDLDGEWDDSDATFITLSDSGSKVSGSGAYAYDGNIVIASGGWFVLSGELSDGSVIVDAYDSSKVWIRLNGVQIHCEDDAALIVDQADKVFLTLAEGTENVLSSGASYSDEALSDGTGGVIFAHDDLTINGSGSLTITAEHKHGIDANDELVITGGRIRVDAPEDGLHVNDEFCFTGADLTIAAGDDAIHSDTSILVAGGNILIEECYEGLEARTIEMTDGTVTIFPSDDGFNANGGTGEMGGFGGGFGSAGTSASEDVTESDETWIRISGGTVTILNGSGSDADGLDSNGDIEILGGTIRISLTGAGTNSAIDYGSESGGVCEISGGTIVACGSYSMAEAFDSTSSQCAILYNFSAGAEAGTRAAVEDADGNVLLSYEVPYSFTSVNFSSPELTLGESYLIVIGDQVEAITIEEISASYGDAASGGFGGTMNFGGMQDRSGFEEMGGMGGERGGHGSEDSGDRSAAPDWSQDSEGSGERPEMGGQSGDFDPSQMGDFDPGQMGGFDPSGGDFGAGFAGGVPAEQTAVEASALSAPERASATALADLEAEVWILLGVSGAALVAGIVFAACFRRRGDFRKTRGFHDTAA